MGWWKRCRSKGRERGVSDLDIAAALRGLKYVWGRIRSPWEPYRIFKRDNRALFQEAMSAGWKHTKREPAPINLAMSNALADLARRTRTGL